MPLACGRRPLDLARRMSAGTLARAVSLGCLGASLRLQGAQERVPSLLSTSEAAERKGEEELGKPFCSVGDEGVRNVFGEDSGAGGEGRFWS